MRIIFVGTVEFSQHCLKEVLKNGGNVVAVYTLAKPDAGFHSDYTDLSNVAIRYQISYYEVEDINDSRVVAQMRSLAPDVIFVFGWSQLISKEILDIPPLGCIGFHPALLPQNRGRHPIVWALVEGLRKSGLTAFFMDQHPDNGDILWQKSFPISLEDDARSVYEKVKTLASEAIREFLPQLEKGTVPRIPQDHTRSTYWRRRTEKDGKIDWSQSTLKVYNLIRALTHPYVGAHTYAASQKVKIWRAQLPQQPLPQEAVDLKPGIIFRESREGIEIRTGDGYLAVSNYEIADGRTICVGTMLGEQL